MLRVLAFLFALGFCATSVQADSEDDCYFGDSNERLANKERTIKACTQIINGKAKGMRHSAYHTRGVFLEYKGEFDRAIADFDHAIKLEPKKALYYTSRGRTNGQKREFDRAIADYGHAIELEPKNADHYMLRGMIYVEGKGEFDRGIADYDHAIKLEPKNAEHYTGRGNAYIQKGEFDRGSADYDHAIKLEPKKIAEYYMGRGNAYIQKGEFERGIKEINKVIELEPKQPEVYILRARAYMKLKRPMAGLVDMDKAFELNPNLKDIGFSLGVRGQIYELLGRKDEAIADIRKALEQKDETLAAPIVKDLEKTLKRLVAAPEQTNVAAQNKGADKTVPTQTGASQEIELSFWNSVKDANDPAMLQAYLDQFPTGSFAALAKIKLGKLKKAP